ncbi:hypothetical protein, partial [Mesorhizobium japonicum]|uniref:hypothetical protein n=1 Tax=Mesorhizobium japonicum TaxID=2066070 RepID=UPI003B58BAD8
RAARSAEAGDAERRRREQFCPPDGDADVARWAAGRWTRPPDADDPVPVRIGRGATTSPVQLEGDIDPDLTGELAAAAEALRAAASEL